MGIPTDIGTAQPVHILVVEDNAAHVKLILRAFREARLRNSISCVYDGEEALDYLYHREPYTSNAEAPRPGLILLDLNLPKRHGMDVLRTIRADRQLRDIPVVVLTSSAADIDLAECYRAYANSYLTKPLDFEEFHQMISQLDYYWTVWNRAPDAPD